MPNGPHNHRYGGETSYTDGHVHNYMGRTSINPDTEGHIIIWRALPPITMDISIITQIIQVLQYILTEDIIIIIWGKPKSQTGTPIVFQGELQYIGIKYPWNKVNLNLWPDLFKVCGSGFLLQFMLTIHIILWHYFG